MPTLVHLADAKEAKKILKNGIKPGKNASGVFFMPVSQDFFGSYQWLRELKRSGAKTFVGIYFKLSSSEEVWYGHYNEKHSKGSLGEGIGDFLERDDRLGYEFLIERKIEASEIVKMRHLRQGIGWRYAPHSHLKESLCVCPICVSRGEINARKKINKAEPPEPRLAYPVLLAKLKTETDEDAVGDLFSQMKSKRRKSDPEELRFIIDRGEESDIAWLAASLSSFKHPNALKMLLELCTHEGDEVRELSAEGILELRPKEGKELLNEFSADPAIARAISD
ncbi:MAG: hypothetical protein HEP71_00195 [Roseivirga sp.]|nr:hypothetical protein [Roseivirga sp.]